jgi:Predicted phosphohydrolases
MREWGSFLFFTSFFCLYFTGSMYIAWRISAGFKLIAPYKFYVYAATGLMASVSLLSFISSVYGIEPFARALNPAGGIWMGIVGITCAVLFANDLLNLGNRFFKIKKFRYYSTVIALAAAVLLCVWSLINAACVLKVKEIKIQVPELKKDKLSIALLADLHIDKHTPPSMIRKIVDIANGFSPDIIVIAGDLTDTDISGTYSEYSLDKLSAGYGVFAVTGNHEYYTGIESYEKLCEKLGFMLLRNENLIINESGENILAVAGINDKQGAKQKTDIVDVEAAFEGIENALPVLFLSHRPQYFDMVKDKKMPVIQLSGHTHAGQILPMELLLRCFFKYSWGLYKHKDSAMYLTSGNRWWRVPMRTFNTCEIVKITLEKN